MAKAIERNKKGYKKMNENKKTVLNDNDIDNILEILQDAKNDGLLIDQNHKLYDFKDQYCVITESVKIDQYQDEEVEADCMYFPNNVLTFENNNYKIIRIYKRYKSDVYFCDYEYTEDYKRRILEKFSNAALKLKKLDKTFTANIEDLFKDLQEMNIKRQLRNNIDDFNYNLKLLKSCKRVSTKSGANFKILNKNVVSDLTKHVNILEDFDYKTGELNQLRLQISTITFSSENVKTVDDIFNILIPEAIKRNEKYINEHNKKIKNLHQVYKKIKDLKKQCRQVAELNGFCSYTFDNVRV